MKKMLNILYVYNCWASVSNGQIFLSFDLNVSNDLLDLHKLLLISVKIEDFCKNQVTSKTLCKCFNMKSYLSVLIFVFICYRL